MNLLGKNDSFENFQNCKSQAAVLAAFIVCGFLSAFGATLALADSNKLKTSREIVLPDFQYKKIKSDLPIDSIIMDKQKTVWMAGKTSIWRWQLESNHLQRIRLIKKPNGDRLRKLLIHQESIVAMSNQQLFELRFNPTRLTKLKSNNRRVVSLNLSANKHDLFWITTGGVYLADLKNQNLIHMSQTPQLFSKDKISFVPKNGSLWFARKKDLFLRNLIDDNVQSKLLLKARNKLTAIHRIDDNIFVHTKHSVLRYSTKGKLRQRIPVEGNRKLVLMSLTGRFHSYLFSDKLLEVFDLSKKNSKHYRLDIGVVKKARNLVNEGSMVALISDGKPRAFQLSGKW